MKFSDSTRTRVLYMLFNVLRLLRRNLQRYIQVYKHIKRAALDFESVVTFSQQDTKSRRVLNC